MPFRNKDAILAVLAPRLPRSGTVLEVGAGTGQHAAHFGAWAATAAPDLAWLPTEADAGMLPSIQAHCAGLAGVAPPVLLDVGAAPPEAWPSLPGGGECGAYSAVYAANVTHIAPWSVTLGLLVGAAARLAPGGRLFLYGPFAVDGAPATPSDAAFHASLVARNPEWGYRDISGDMLPAALHAGLQLDEAPVPMPANNFVLVFRKSPA